MIAAYILIRTEAGQAAIVAAALRDLAGVSETASLAGPYDVIARAQARDIDELAKLVALRVQALDGVTQTMSCPVVHLREPIAMEHHTTIHEVARAASRKKDKARPALAWPAPLARRARTTAGAGRR